MTSPNAPDLNCELALLRARCAAMERSHTRWRAVTIGALLIAGAMFLMGQAARHKQLEAQAFILLDDTGRDRAQLTVDKEGSTALVLKSPDGVTDASLAILQNRALAFRLRSPRKEVSFEIAQDGVAALRINEKYARSSVELGVDSAGRPRLILTDAEGKIVHKAP